MTTLQGSQATPTPDYPSISDPLTPTKIQRQLLEAWLNYSANPNPENAARLHEVKQAAEKLLKELGLR